MSNTVNVSRSQLETVAMEAYQKALNDFALDHGLSLKDVADHVSRNMEQDITEVAESAFKRYSN